MQNVDTLRLPADNGIDEARAMLDKRGIDGKETGFLIDDASIGMMWSFARGPVCVVGVINVDKSAATSIVRAFKEAQHATQLVVLYRNKCTIDGAKELDDPDIDVFSINEIYHNPFKFSFFESAGLIREVTPDILEQVGGDLSKCKGIYKHDPLAKYLGAKEKQIVWTLDRYGTLEPSMNYRVVRSGEY